MALQASLAQAIVAHETFSRHWSGFVSNAPAWATRACTEWTFTLNTASAEDRATEAHDASNAGGCACLHVGDGGQGLELVYQRQVLEGTGLEVHGHEALLALCDGVRAALHALCVIPHGLHAGRHVIACIECKLQAGMKASLRADAQVIYMQDSAQDEKQVLGTWEQHANAVEPNP